MTVNCESWDGSSWTEVANTNTGRQLASSAGASNTSALGSGGEITPGGGNQTLNESWNGTSWTEVGDLNTARYSGQGAGTQTAALTFGGDAPGGSTENVESWDGSSWTEVGDLNTTRYALGGDGATNTAALAFGGENPSPGRVAATENWDGTSWTEVADLATAREQIRGAGTNSFAFAAGGATPGTVHDATEEWSAPATFRQLNVGDIYYNADPSSGVIKYVGYGTGAWAAGGSTNTARGNGFSFGSQTAGIFASGYTGSNVDNVENYNGSSWTEIAEVNTARREGAGFGTSTAGLVFGGRPPVTTNTESWNGSSWTETADLNLARADSHVRAGTSTDGIYSGGADGSPASETYLVVQTEKWDGSSWTEVGDMNTGREAGGNAGTSSSYALAVGGNPPSPGAVVESWNGTSWTEVGDLNTARSWCTGSGGSNTDSINFGGRTPGSSNENKTESWNGSSWTEVADMATARYTQGSSSNGTTKAGLCIMGNNGSYITNTEEWTVPEGLKTLASTNA